MASAESRTAERDGAKFRGRAKTADAAAIRARYPGALVDSIVVVATYATTCGIVRLAGFDHVSDDDFSRVTIAQAFAHAPKLDPSGTSWLPFPFWVLGTAMTLFGRSYGVAQGVSMAIASAAASTPYLALRFAGLPRGRALAATAFALGTPWFLWLGAATVPESFTATLTAAGVVGLSAARADERRQDGWAWPEVARRSAIGSVMLFALALAAACLSRYEPWPIAATLAMALSVSAVRDTDSKRRVLLMGAAVACAFGPLSWMAWNAHAHDGPFHFFHRVSSYKRAIGAGSTNTVEALLLYPRLLFTTRPELVIPTIFLLVPALRDPSLRRRWGLPLLCAFAQVAFLAYGNARDGAPAHHPERALVGTMAIGALFVADAGFVKLRELVRDGRTLAAKTTAACIAVAWAISSVRGYEPPGRGPSEDRSQAIARGTKLRDDGVRAIVVTPCAYEHFALLAAYGAPENAELKPPAPPTPGAQCPAVEIR